MTPATRTGLSVVGAAVAVGIIADLLLPAAPWGLNLSLCVAAVVGAGAWLATRAGTSPSSDAAWLALTALLLGAAFLRRDAELLQLLDFAALLAVLALAAVAARGASVRGRHLGAYVAALVASARNALLGGAQLALRDVAWRDVPLRGVGPVRRALLGAVIALPLLLVFGALFAEADPIFSQTVSGVLNVDLGQATAHTLRTGVFAWLAAGYLRGVTPLHARPAEAGHESGAPQAADRALPVLAALVLVDLLFACFVIIQLRYFFGGAALVNAVPGLTYAEYARHGFFALLLATGLVLPVLLTAEWVVRGAPPVAIRRFRLAAVALLALLAVVVASALERMRLYVAAFGLTEDRLYATAAMGYVVVLLVWLGWTVLRGRGERFAFGGLVQGLALLAGLHLVNPDALIVRHNVARPGSERPLDVAYASSLSADAAPLVLAMLPRLEGRDACIAAQGLARWAEDEADWRTWNWPRARARRIAHAPEVAAALTRCEPAPSTPTPDP